MEPKKLLQADYLDIIFDQRNKNYGSYELRKHYDRRMRKGALFLLAGVILLSSFSLISKDRISAPDYRQHVADTLTYIPIDPKIEPPKEIIPPKPAAPKPQLTKIFTDPVITKDLIKPDQQMAENKDMANAKPGITNTDGDSPDITPSGHGKTGTEVIEHIAEPPAKPVVFVEQMPQFNGSMEKYIGSHLRYPDAARETGIDGRVIVQFVVNEDGSVSDAKVVRGIGGGCDEEALRMVGAMPKWKPGKQNGKAVKVLFTLPIKFLLR